MPSMHPVLLIDDDEKLGNVLTRYVAGFSIALEHALTPEAGFDALASGRFEAVILDVMLPGMSGFEVLRELRRDHDLPVIMLSARGDVTDRVVGLEIGADDYLTKPFEPRELVARVLANLRRPARVAAIRTDAAPSKVQRYGRLTLDSLKRQAFVDGESAKLTSREFDLVEILASEPGRPFSRDEILATLTGTEHELFTRAVDILISRVRAKLRPLEPIHTRRGAGYVFTARDEA